MKVELCRQRFSDKNIAIAAVKKRGKVSSLWVQILTSMASKPFIAIENALLIAVTKGENSVVNLCVFICDIVFLVSVIF